MTELTIKIKSDLDRYILLESIRLSFIEWKGTDYEVIEVKD